MNLSKFFSFILMKMFPFTKWAKSTNEQRLFNKIIDNLKKHLSQEKPPKNVRFHFGRTLGIGAFGRVKLVHYQEIGKRKCDVYFALKTVKFRNFTDSKERKHLDDEVSMLGQKMHGYFIFNQTYFILMDYIVGGELFTKLREETRFSRKTAAFYAAEVLEAIDYLHKKNILYRDLKTENIMIDNEGHVKLVDFGFAKVLKSGMTNTLCGTTEYLAPETMSLKGYGKPADWWSLGILIYEMLTGDTPFRGKTIKQQFHLTLRKSVRFPGYVDAVSRDLVLKLLNPEASVRLGKDGSKDIRSHPFFKDINWKKLYKRKVKPPSVPEIYGKGDTSYFDVFAESKSYCLVNRDYDD